MSTTAAAPQTAVRRQKDKLSETLPASGEQLAPPPKLRRRPIMIAASVAAICLGALASAWAYTSTSNTQSVLAVRETVHRGDTITRGDLMTATIGVDPALHPLSGEQFADVVGKRAAMDMPAGGVVTQEQVTETAVPAKGESVVGISVTPAMLPADQLEVGDPVRIVTTPGQQGEITAEAPGATEATVVGVSTDAQSGNTIVNVQVPYSAAPDVAARAATGKVAIVLDSQEG